MVDGFRRSRLIAAPESNRRASPAKGADLNESHARRQRRPFLLFLLALRLAAQQPAPLSPRPRTAAQAPESRHQLYRCRGHGARDARGPGAGDHQPAGATGAGPRHARPGPAGVAGGAAQAAPTHTRPAPAWPGAQICPNQLVERKDRRRSGAHCHAGRNARGEQRQGAAEPARRRLQLRFGLVHGVDSHRRLRKDQGRRCALPPGAGASVSRGRGRLGSRVQGTAEDLQAGAHRDLRNLGRRHPDRRSGREAQATRAAHARRAGHLQRHGRFCAQRRLDGAVCAARLSGHLDPPTAGRTTRIT